MNVSIYYTEGITSLFLLNIDKYLFKSVNIKECVVNENLGLDDTH